ncbi:hypothetical protein AOLI_G00310580 [Acnodon oligacanthus]
MRKLPRDEEPSILEKRSMPERMLFITFTPELMQPSHDEGSMNVTERSYVFQSSQQELTGLRQQGTNHHLYPHVIHPPLRRILPLSQGWIFPPLTWAVFSPDILSDTRAITLSLTPMDRFTL